LRPSAFALLAFVFFVLGGCVEPFRGSHIEVTLAEGVHTPGASSAGGRPPPGTHYTFYGVEYVRDEMGDVTSSFAHKVLDFYIQPVIATGSPCFMEDDESRFPGLHATEYANKLREVTGIDDPFAPPAGASEGDVIDILTADVRMGNQGKLQTSVKAVTTFSPALYPDFSADCTCDFDDGLATADLAALAIPPATCSDDACNRKRRAVCQAFWSLHEARYEGNDKVFTLPLNGAWRGAVTGTDPRNNQFIGGAGFFVEANLAGIDALQISWQFDCAISDYETNGDDCMPVYPEDFPEAARSATGFHYLAGEKVEKTRGVQNFPMTNQTFGTIRGEAVIFADLDQDDVHF
jgi:hypothetical protein